MLKSANLENVKSNFFEMFLQRTKLAILSTDLENEVNSTFKDNDGQKILTYSGFYKTLLVHQLHCRLLPVFLTF